MLITDGEEQREETAHTEQVQSLRTGPALHGTSPAQAGVEGDSHQTYRAQWGREYEASHQEFYSDHR